MFRIEKRKVHSGACPYRQARRCCFYKLTDQREAARTGTPDRKDAVSEREVESAQALGAVLFKRP